MSWSLIAGLILLSMIGPFRPDSGATWLRVLWVIGYLTAGVPHLLPQQKWDDPLRGHRQLLLLLLMVHLLTQMTGGLRSFLLPLYLVLMLWGSVRYGLSAALLGGFLAVLVGLGDLYQAPEAWREVVLYPLLLFAIPFAAQGYLGLLHEERQTLRQRVERIEGEMGLLEGGWTPGQGMGADGVSEEEQAGQTLSTVRQMGDAMEGWLRVLVEAVSAMPPAFIPSSEGRLFPADPQVHAAVVLLMDRDREGLWVTSGWGMGGPLLQRDRIIPIEKEKGGLLGRLLKEGRNLSISNFDRRRGGPGYYLHPVPIGSLLVVPLTEGEKVIGLICLDSLSSGFFSERHERVVQEAAQEMVFLLRMFRERHHVIRTAREFSVLLEVSRHLSSRLDLSHRLETTAEQAHKVVPYDQCMILLLEPGERRGVIKVARGFGAVGVGKGFAMNGGLLSLVVKTRQPLLFSDLRGARKARVFPDGFQWEGTAASFLGIPMEVEDRIIGVVLFLSQSPNRFTAYHQHLLSLLCSHVALSVAEAQLHSQVKHLAAVDGLTGATNHRRFQERLHEEIARTRRHPDPFSLLMVDIDHFKKINDTYGHPCGDAVLKSVSKTLNRLVRKTDLVARYGGEEFAVLLLKADASQGETLAERIRRTVEKTPVIWEGTEVRVTVSIGVANFPSDADQGDGLILRADRALYASKHEGRNRVRVYRRLNPQGASHSGRDEQPPRPYR